MCSISTDLNNGCLTIHYRSNRIDEADTICAKNGFSTVSLETSSVTFKCQTTHIKYAQISCVAAANQKAALAVQTSLIGCSMKFYQAELGKEYRCIDQCVNDGWVIATRPIDSIPNGNYPRIRGYKSNSSICRASTQAGLETGRVFVTRRTEIDTSKFQKTFQNGITGLTSSTSDSYWTFSNVLEQYLPKTQCDVMRHINETKDFS